ncbi:MAG: DUF3307 domain-containing protein, partial [Planctomycetales bacterium]|nr:DUF3307 domain-containing protein [Planctomycetales bacterium]
IGAHCFFDYAGQGDFMSNAKNQEKPIPGVPAATVMWSHAAIQGAAVAYITGIWLLFFFEAVCHYLIDRSKCAGKMSFNQDQALHILCKLIWWGMAIAGAFPGMQTKAAPGADRSMPTAQCAPAFGSVIGRTYE